ncbi:MAG TPA: hypothetical protein VGJ20_38905 [Xanthobacteraceae bacterium]|jgi:hypothetical protein
MMNRPKLAFVAAVMAAAIVSTGLAQAAPVAGKSHHNTLRHSSRNDIVALRRGRVYNYAPPAPAPRSGLYPDSPALTGGGSLGYNLNIYNW